MVARQPQPQPHTPKATQQRARVARRWARSRSDDHSKYVRACPHLVPTRATPFEFHISFFCEANRDPRLSRILSAVNLRAASYRSS